MRAMQFSEYGDAGVLTSVEIDRPEPGSGEVLVRVSASAFNPADAGIRGGWLRDAFPLVLPHTPGYDVAGTVEGGDHDGEAVIGFLPMTGQGGAAQYVVAPEEALVAAPTAVALTDAAALPSTGLTAWQALFEHADLQAGQRVLVNGAGGSVGGAAVRLARWAGAEVVAITSASAFDRVRDAGAAEVIDQNADGVPDVAPVDVLLNVGGVPAERLTALTALVRPGGVVVNTVPAIRAQGDDARGVRAVGMFVHPDRGALARLVGLVDAGDLRIDVAERVPLSELAAVHARSDAGTLRGKVVVVPPA